MLKSPAASPRPPGPTRWEALRDLGPTPLRHFPTYLRAIAERYGPIVAFDLPWRPFYFVNDPALIKEILVTQQQAFMKSEGTRTMRMLLGDGLLTSDEPLHRRMRRIVQPAFHRERIAAYGRTMSAHACELTLAPLVDMHAAMTNLTLRIASATLFGLDAGPVAERVSHNVREANEVFPLVLGPIGRLRRRFPFRSTRRFDAARDALDDVLAGLIAQRRASGTDNGDVLSMLLATRDAETGEPLDDVQVRDEAMTLFLAGHETTAAALSWTWYLLAQHPDADARMRREIDEVLGTQPAGLEHLDALPYVRAVIAESMRLYPPVWIMGRNPIERVEIGGYEASPQTAVLMSPLVMHRNPAYFFEPDRFVPERWLDMPELPQFAYFPFGGGSRRCIGDQFALIEATIVLTALAQRYRFELDARANVKPLALVTLRPDSPVWMRAIPR